MKSPSDANVVDARVPDTKELLETRHAFCRLVVVTNKLEIVG